MRWRMIVSLLVIAWVVSMPVTALIIANEEVGMSHPPEKKATPTPRLLTTPTLTPGPKGWWPEDYSDTNEQALVLDGDTFVQYLNDLPLGEYTLCFYVDTKSLTGHGFIKLRFPDGSTHGFGFYPSPGGKFIQEPFRLFDNMAGFIDPQDIKTNWTAKVCYKINKYQAQAVLSTVNAYRFAPYHLLTNNCIHFVNAVAKAADLPQISGTDTMTKPGNLYENIKKQPGSVENTNKDDQKEMAQDPTGAWVPWNGYNIPSPQQVQEKSASQQTVKNEIGTPGPAKKGIETPQGLMNSVNEKIGMLPADLQKMIDNRRVLVVMAGDKGDPQLSPVGFTFRGSALADVEPGVDNPDYRVYATARAVDSLLSAQDPVATFRSALARGDIQIQPSAPGDMALIGGAGFLNKVSLLMSPSPYNLKVGQQKDVTIGGSISTLLRPKNIILLQKKDSNDATVVNSDGATQGYTTAGTVRVISLSPQDHSMASGVYTSPAADIRAGAQSGFAMPDSFRPGTGQAITDPSACTLQGGADAAHLIAGGAGFLHGYRRGP